MKAVEVRRGGRCCRRGGRVGCRPVPPRRGRRLAVEHPGPELVVDATVGSSGGRAHGMVSHGRALLLGRHKVPQHSIDGRNLEIQMRSN